MDTSLSPASWAACHRSATGPGSHGQRANQRLNTSCSPAILSAPGERSIEMVCDRRSAAEEAAVVKISMSVLVLLLTVSAVVLVGSPAVLAQQMQEEVVVYH